MLKYAMISILPKYTIQHCEIPQFTGYIKRFTEMRTEEKEFL